jgi:hypothetical protein
MSRSYNMHIKEQMPTKFWTEVFKKPHHFQDLGMDRRYRYWKVYRGVEA